MKTNAPVKICISFDRCLLSPLRVTNRGPARFSVKSALTPPGIKGCKMSDAYVVQVGGQTAGIVVRDTAAETFSFFAATHRFNSLEGQQYAEPYAAERAARQLIARRDFHVVSDLRGAL